MPPVAPTAKSHMLPPERLLAPRQVGGRVLIMQLLDAQQQLLQVLTRDRRQGDGLLAQAGLQRGQVGSRLREVNLIGDDDMGPFRQALLVLLQLVLQVLDLGPGLWRCQVHHEQEEAAALDVSEEGQAQASVLVRASDDARDVGHCGDRARGRATSGPFPEV